MSIESFKQSSYEEQDTQDREIESVAEERVSEEAPTPETLLAQSREQFNTLPKEEQERLAGLHESLNNVGAALEITGEEGEDLVENRFIAYQGLDAMRDVYDNADLEQTNGCFRGCDIAS